MTRQPLLVIESALELRVLLSAIVQAKLRPIYPDTDLVGSPFIVAVVERAVAAMETLENNSGDPIRIENMRTWRSLDENPIIQQAVRDRIAELPSHVWHRWSSEERLAVVKQVISPFLASEQLLTELLNAGPEV